jgi:hypothetical protein
MPVSPRSRRKCRRFASTGADDGRESGGPSRERELRSTRNRLGPRLARKLRSRHEEIFGFRGAATVLCSASKSSNVPVFDLADEAKRLTDSPHAEQASLSLLGSQTRRMSLRHEFRLTRGGTGFKQIAERGPTRPATSTASAARSSPPASAPAGVPGTDCLPEPSSCGPGPSPHRSRPGRPACGRSP